MSAVVCGKRSFFEEIPSPPISKRARCSSSSSSPIQVSPSRSGSAAHSPSSPSSSLLLDHIISLFPDMDHKLLERVLEECDNHLDSTIKSLNELRLRVADNDLHHDVFHYDKPQPTNQAEVINNEHIASPGDTPASANLPKDGAEWVELFVEEMLSAANLDDARLRAARALDALEKSILARSGTESVQNLQQENAVLKQQIQVLLHENTVLKRAVAIQHERQKEFDDKTLELQHLKQLVSQYQEQLRTLEVNNYALAMHLKQAQQSSSIPGRFNPDVF